MQKIVILPGLDGTGLLLDAFVARLRESHDARTITWPPDAPLGYDDLVEWVRPRLPTQPFFLIGESFSGPVALRLAALCPGLVKGVILGASFARIDLPLKRQLACFARHFPIWKTPGILLNFGLMGGSGDAVQIAALRAALTSVRPEVVRLRLQEVLRIDLVRDQISVNQPVLHLRALNDRLVPRNAVNAVRLIAPHLRVEDIAAPHFLFQAKPDICASHVLSFVSSNSR